MDRDIVKMDFESEFSKVSQEQLRAMTEGFMEDYGTPKTQLGRRVGLSDNTLGRWLVDGEPLSEKSLKRIFKFLAEYYPRWRDFVNEVKE